MYTIGPERRVTTMKASDPDKGNMRVAPVVVYRLCSLLAGVLRGNTMRGNTTRNSERKMAL